jgi:hypothetical protein
MAKRGVSAPMARLVILAVAAAFSVALLAPATTQGKGALSGEIAGPGLQEPIVMSGTWNQLGRISEAGGFYAAVFGRDPSPLLDTQPRGGLGPRYTITYVMPGPFGATGELVQDVYPYAKPLPVTFTAEGQSFFGNHESRGGWFVAAPALKDYLVEAGLPPAAPTLADESGGTKPIAVGAAVALGTVLAGCALAGVLVRRRPRIA